MVALDEEVILIGIQEGGMGETVVGTREDTIAFF